MDKRTVFSVIKWASLKISSKMREICLCPGEKTVHAKDLASLVRANMDIIELVTIEDFCGKFGININREKVVIRYPPSLLDRQLLLMFHSEITALAILARGMDARNIFEIGTFEGNTAANIAYNVSDESSVYTLDFPLYRICARAEAAVKYVENDARAKKIVRILEGDSLQFDFSPFHNKVDIMYIDGGKTYKCVFSDSENAYKCVRPGGLVVWHDFLTFDKDYLVVPSVVFDFCRKYHLKAHLIDGTRMVIAKKPEGNA